MKMFASAREAKEFLVSRIVSEAEVEGVPLSETERKGPYFSESAWTLPGMPQINDEFERNYDQDEYEQKIAGLVGRARRRDGQENPEGDKFWSERLEFSIGKTITFL